MCVPVTFTLTKYVRIENTNTQLEAHKNYQTLEIHPYLNIKPKRLRISEQHETNVSTETVLYPSI